MWTMHNIFCKSGHIYSFLHIASYVYLANYIVNMQNLNFKKIALGSQSNVAKEIYYKTLLFAICKSL